MGACCCALASRSERVETSMPEDIEVTKKHRVLQRTPRISRHLTRLTISLEAGSSERSHPLKSGQDKALIVSCLQKVFLFADCTPQDLEPFVEAMPLFTLKAWETVMEEGQTPQYLFILSYGRIELSCQGKFLREVCPGEDFSLSSLISDTPRPATATTLEPSGFWTLDKYTFEELLKTFKQAESQRLKTVLNNAEVFLGLLPKQKESLCEAIEMLRLKEGTVVVEQDTEGDSCFIIKVGTVACSKDGVEIRRLGPGELFGEQALLYGGRRTASVRTITPTVLWKIEREGIVNALGDSLDKIMYRNSIRIAFDKNPVLSRLSHKHKEKLIAKLHISKYQHGATAISTLPGQIFFLLQGTLTAANETQKLVKTFSMVGDIMECSTPSNPKCADYIVTSESAVVAALDTTALAQRLQSPITSAMEWAPSISDLRKVMLFVGEKDTTLIELAKNAVVRSFSRDEVIISENDHANTVYMIASGEVEVTIRGQYVRSLGSFDYFGERAVLLNTCRTATVTSKADTLCWAFERSHLLFLFQNTAVKERLTARIAQQDDSVTLSDLVVIRQIAQGYPGTPFLVVHSTNSSFYALEIIEKANLPSENLRNLEQEKRLRRNLYHPFIEKQVKVMEEERFVYIISEYCNGSDLFGFLRNLSQVLTENEAKFYISCLILAVEYLHSRQIAMRNLEPTNILIDSSGYPLLCGLEYAKKLSEKTFTTVGAPHYLAPEVIKRQGYGVSVDYWSLGVLLYEFLYGKVPFGEEETDPMEIYNEILTRELTFPKQSGPVLDVMRSLLERQPTRRARGSLSKLKKMPWFRGVDWVSATQEGLLLKQIKSPYTLRERNVKANLAKALAKGETVKHAINVLHR